MAGAARAARGGGGFAGTRFRIRFSAQRIMRGEPLSVVIPCYNAARFVAGAIQSVLDQGWLGTEVIVVDDGSTDSSAELIATRFPQVRLIRQANQGVAAARNRGIREASHDWIAFLDADDLWLPGKLNAQAALLETDPSARLVYSAWQVWRGEGPAPSATELRSLLADERDVDRWTGPSGWIYSELLLDCAVWTSTVVAHRALFEAVGGFDAGLRVGEDYDLWLRASRKTRILRVNRPFALYRLHGSSITHSVPQENYHAIVISRAIAQWGYGHPAGGVAVTSQVQRALARSWSAYSASSLVARDYERAGRGAWTALRTDPSHFMAWKLLLKTALGALRPGGSHSTPAQVADRKPP